MTGERTTDDAAAAAAAGTLREAQRYFGGKAEAYRTSRAHGNQADLDRMLRLADARPGQRALDVATGGGHAALALARAGLRVVATDATPAMLDAVQRSAHEAGVPLDGRALADAQRLPFAAASFDLVASRIAPHHFPDLDAFVRESARVLRPGGALYVFDLTTPEDADAARVVNRIETLRDPSHVDSYAPSRWRAALDRAGLRVERLETTASEFDLEAWVARAEMAPERERELRGLLAAWTPERLGGYGVVGEGRMRVRRVEVVGRRE